jgi:hypothetical protein
MIGNNVCRVNDLVATKSIQPAALRGAPVNPHTFLTNITASTATLTIEAPEQIATFFGTVVIDPDRPGPLFEVSIAGPLPEGLNF